MLLTISAPHLQAINRPSEIIECTFYCACPSLAPNLHAHL